MIRAYVVCVDGVWLFDVYDTVSTHTVTVRHKGRLVGTYPQRAIIVSGSCSSWEQAMATVCARLRWEYARRA